MRLRISHRTVYRYDNPVVCGLQEIRLVPKSRAGQAIVDWSIKLQGVTKEAEFEDQHNNVVWLTNLEPGAQEISIICQGEVENSNGTGIVGKHGGHAPLWYFQRSTALTKSGEGVTALIKQLEPGEDALARLHKLSYLIFNTVSYETGTTVATTTAEAALANERGVCQDHAQIMIAAARELGHPARYVSGYLMMNDRVAQDATHAWAEIHLDGIGWVGFDVSNGISPDERYIRVATGLDYRDAAPISGLRIDNSAGGNETMQVSIQVQQ
ncbi:MAG: transglutaminase family protein [Rhizobiaceae bacterium]